MENTIQCYYNDPIELFEYLEKILGLYSHYYKPDYIKDSFFFLKDERGDIYLKCYLFSGGENPYIYIRISYNTLVKVVTISKGISNLELLDILNRISDHIVVKPNSHIKEHVGDFEPIIRDIRINKILG